MNRRVLYEYRRTHKAIRKESKSDNDWFKMNDMIANPNKFQEMILSCDKKENKCDSNINNSITISYVDFVAFLGIEIHSKWNFEKQVVTII